MISVIICTKNKQSQLLVCLHSLVINKFTDCEILVIDQTNISLRNFTDDDCVVSTNWLDNISRYFKKNKGIFGVFGKTSAYQPEKHKGLICYALTDNLPEIIDNPDIIFTRDLGKGNNMAWRKEALKKLGNFKTWLGPGAKTGTAGGEETEIVYRALLHGYKIGFNPKMIVYHNKWITKKESKKLSAKKSLGNIAFLVYYFLKNHDWSLLTKTLIFKVNSWYLIKGYLIGIFACILKK